MRNQALILPEIMVKLKMTDSYMEVPSELVEAMSDIDDKLRERGFLVSLCGDETAESSLHFLFKEDEGVYLQVKVTAGEDASVNEEVAERISDYVSSKIYDFFGEGSFDIEDDFMGVEVYVNDKLAY